MSTLSNNGAFARDGRPWVPFGFNYWPPESGVECWTETHWSPAPFARDFRAMRELGFDCVRMFLRWPEFQPREDSVDQTALTRLAEVGSLAAEVGIRLIPTLFVGFMSGGVYPPPWLNGRNLFVDPDCIRATAELATGAARVLAPTGSVLAYDFSNEINVWCNHLPALTPEQTVAWQRRMKQAIHAGHPGALVMNGTNHSAIIAEMPWDLRHQRQVPLDLLSMHVYPVRNWNALPVDSLGSYEAETLAAVHVAMARAYGPVMMQEFGVALPVTGRAARDYVFLSTVACWLAGSNGFLMWGWRDFETAQKPYRDNPFEKEICFMNGQGEVKEMGRGFVEAGAFIRELADFRPCRPEIAIYLGDAYWEGPQATLGNSIRCFWLSTALRRAHLAHAFTDTIDSAYGTLVVPGPRLNLDEIAALRVFVAGGGHVLLANPGWNYWCDDLKAMADLDLLDMATFPGDTALQAGDVEVMLPAQEYVPVATPRGAAVRAVMGEAQVPALLVSAAGNGPVATLFTPVGRELVGHPFRFALDRLLAPVFHAWGLSPEADGLPPDVTVCSMENAAGEQRLVLLNHGLTTFAGPVRWLGRDLAVSLKPKAAMAVTAPGDRL